MKTLNTYINEKLVLNKDTFKKSVYKYFPKTKGELQDILKQLLNERKDQDVIDLNDVDTSEITDMSELFCQNGKIKKINLSRWNVSKVENMNRIFAHCENLESTGDLSSWDVSEVINMGYMFHNCGKLKDIGDISSWNTSKVTNMFGMFGKCKNLKYIGDLSSWNISDVKDISYMFYKCNEIETVGDLSNWKISKVEDMRSMFSFCENLEYIGDLSDWNVSKRAFIEGRKVICRGKHHAALWFSRFAAVNAAM